MSSDTFDSGAQMDGPGPGPDVSSLVSGPSIARSAAIRDGTRLAFAQCHNQFSRSCTSGPDSKERVRP